MGISLSWIAVKHRTLRQVTENLAIDLTSQTEGFPESDISGANLNNDWCHIQFLDFESPYICESNLIALSSDTTVIISQIEEHLMHSKSCCWENGHLVWSVEHDAQQSSTHITTHGELPGSFDKISKEQFDNQKCGNGEVDYIFEIPVDLADSITNIRHDEFPDENIEYHILKPRSDCNRKSKGLWKKTWW